ncbi:transcription factor IIIb subunit, putative [Plasmodium knowlesi strain H]|uniref:B-related factor 1 n=3 Tax=Plasmodium knowlesi TaxID=5850 RepID=A0A1A7VLN3_PLAKH|nr:transcription factor IIIb subunit, putative [Plasmodium knowlesi strain H]OTN65517.1 putative Transcription factor IIIb subunit [Plasmodium knowlesi]CAA9989656.1 transcription factor IIIb subunit, putative [Plasmodium knowlesi strain H]SBO22770.1 transcription factor IIIb subunit, putative [Plasmodium knowlesi strain H]SBO23130.1 transcription factor IIIb subunit, putative [Plasmodium knowlesi strain H]VVS79130.1 transcription factor IIIb subunit, putative [Plasmodium knowlesi strain H]
MVGQFVPASGNKSFILSWGVRESRELSLQKGYINIQKIAEHLHLSTQHVESAQRIYLMALQRNFTMGRNNSYVAASCLYTICRREKSPVMLIDFSDILQTPVKPLGKTFLKLLRLLHISVPNIDPSLYLERFAHKLNLKNDIYKVTYTGIKLIQAMTRDWICTGRRPTGLCGAALLISTRMHGIFVHSNTIANIVRISNPTIIKRLSEFKNTSTAKMKVSDFDKIRLNDLPSNSLPPCVIASKRRKFREDMLRNNKAVSLCDSEEISSTVASAKCGKDSEQHLTNDTYSPNCNEDTFSLSNTINNTNADDVINADDAPNALSYNNLTLLDSRSSCNGMEDATTTECSVNGGGSTRGMGRTGELNSTISSCLPGGSILGGSQTGDDVENLTTNGINVEEICNENPEGNDLDELAKKIINTIDVEKQSSILKVNVSSLHMNNSHCDGSDSEEASEKEKIQFSHSNKQWRVKKENDQIDNPAIQSTVSIATINHLSHLESCLTTPMISPQKFIPSNGTYKNGKCTNGTCTNGTCTNGKCTNGSLSSVQSEKQNMSKAIQSHDNKNGALSKKVLHNDPEMGDRLDSLNNDPETTYSSTLKETFNSELSHLLNEVDDLNILEYANNAKENKLLHEPNDMHKDDVDHVSSIMSDFNYFFENNSNTVESQPPNATDIPSDASVEQFNESLSDFYDSEIENIILSEKERKRKMLIWDDMMKSYFPQYYKQFKKQKKKRSSYHTDLVGADKSKKKKKKEQEQEQNDHHPLDEQTTGESVIMALEKSDKSMSTKMNYDVLKSLFSS